MKPLVVVLDGKESPGDFFSTLLQGLKTENVKAESFMNGAMTLQISGQGKEQSIIQHTGGQTTIALADGNQHRNMLVMILR